MTDQQACSFVELVGSTHFNAINELLSACVWGDRDKVATVYNSYMSNDDYTLYGMLQHQVVAGLMGVRYRLDHSAIVRHIAVREDCRHQGIGKRMISEYVGLHAIRSLEAETDHDAVEFYRQCGFQIQSLGEKYPGVERFRCTIKL
ncbi:GNAT family N-acetyltransferase [Paenibacillus daejeonensis]|uniref:GNAT family N-acetyltransferase n=1 Tax=Paenibacillus daejeonensis TaxID=135193 RepID=UPI00036D24EF|nr:GNAT family N-acetyltransferase [Paenibacillus daejeonensis]